MDTEVDYKQLYLKMMNATEHAIRVLIQAQRECEELYISLAEEGTAADAGKTCKNQLTKPENML